MQLPQVRSPVARRQKYCQQVKKKEVHRDLTIHHVYLTEHQMPTMSTAETRDVNKHTSSVQEKKRSLTHISRL